MPDNVAFCPGCGLRMWIPGREAGKPGTTSAATPVGSIPSTKIPVRPKANLLAAVAYITFIPAVIFVLVEPFKRDRFVRFHSFQSLFLAVATILVAVVMRILYSLLTLIPVLGYLLAWLAMAVTLLGWVILWVVLLVKALQGETFRLPWIGNFAEKA
jgi:uncharacterized membrane protein